MFRHKQHAAIINAVSKTPAAIVCDVDQDPDTGFVCIETRGASRGYRYYRPEELTERGGENFAAENVAYRHVYFCADIVPAEVRGVLSA